MEINVEEGFFIFYRILTFIIDLKTNLSPIKLFLYLQRPKQDCANMKIGSIVKK